jgi:membrane-associated HD superfamily phosphohydrolase
MATPLDITALKQFSGVFPFLLTVVLMYAILSMTAWFKEKKTWAAMIAIITGFMTLLSPIAIKSINLMAPWFVLFVIFLILFVLAFMLFGFEQKAITDFIVSGEYGIGTWVMAIMLIIGIGSVVFVVNEEKSFGELTAGNQTGVKESDEFGFWQTLFHPKVLGMALILLLSFFTIKYMTKSE